MIPDNRRTLLAVVLVAAMALSAVALIDVSDDGVDGYTDGTKAVIGNDEYSTLSAAVSAATASATVKLVTDVTENITITTGKDIVLDLNGYKLENANNNHTIYVESGAKLTINGPGTVKVSADEKSTVFNQYGEVVLNGGNYTRGIVHGYVVVNHGTMTVNEGVSVSNTYSDTHSSLFENGWYYGSQNNTRQESVLTINGGLFDGGLNSLKNDNYGVANIYDGTFLNTIQCSLLNWNEVNIYGGYFDNTGSGYNLLSNGHLNSAYDFDKGIMNIYGGEFVGPGIFGMNEDSTDQRTATVYGGIFSKNFSGTSRVFIADGYEMVRIGDSYCVSKITSPYVNGAAFSQDNTVIANMGSFSNATISMPSASISITGNNAIGDIMVSAELRTQNYAEAPDAIASYEITIVASTSYMADITVAADIPNRQQPVVYFIDDSGNLVPVEVVSYTYDSVTFRTTHTTPFIVMTEDATSSSGGEEEKDYPFFPDHGNNTGNTSDDSSDDSTKLTIASATIVVMMLAAVALMVTRNN